MRAFDPCRPAWAAATLVTVGATVLVGTTVPAAVAAPPSITFQDPGSVVAGEVELRGVVTTQAAPTTTVLYLVDVSQSTKTPSGVDCDADGVAGGAADNLNGDTGIGDTLDCEIGAIKAINAGLVASAGRSLASLETFAGSAAPVNLVPGSSPATLFVAPGAPGAGGQPAIVAAAAALRRDPVPGTSYDPAVTTALNTLRGAPAGPKYIMLLTDGGGNASSSTVNALAASGVRLRSFAIANDKGCSLSSDLRALSEASGDACYQVSSPAGLPPVLGAAQPPSVSSVLVSIGGHTYSAILDLAGGWRLPLTLGAGTWTSTATAVLSDGSRIAAQRTFVVQPSASGPPPGTVAGPASAPTVLNIDRPGAMTAALPRRVTGRAGSPVLGTARTVDGLQNAVVLLQGLSTSTRRWVTVGRGQVGATGAFVLDRRSTTAVDRLQVLLLPRGRFAGTSARVPAPTVSHCRAVRRGAGFGLRCLTVAPKGAAVRLLKRGVVVDRAVVRRGAFRVSGHSARRGHVVVVTGASGVAYRLQL